MVIFNFRADRVVELSKALEYKDFNKFDRKKWPDVSISVTPPAAHNLNLAQLLRQAVQILRTQSRLCSQQGMRFHVRRGVIACMLLQAGP